MQSILELYQQKSKAYFYKQALIPSKAFFASMLRSYKVAHRVAKSKEPIGLQLQNNSFYLLLYIVNLMIGGSVGFAALALGLNEL